jgi:hypothetical protein
MQRHQGTWWYIGFVCVTSCKKMVLFTLQPSKKISILLPYIVVLSSYLFIYLFIFCFILQLPIFLLCSFVIVCISNCVLLYGSIWSFIRGIGKLIRQRQNQWVAKIGVTLAIGFNIFIDARYNRVKLEVDEVAM